MKKLSLVLLLVIVLGCSSIYKSYHYNGYAIHVYIETIYGEVIDIENVKLYRNPYVTILQKQGYITTIQNKDIKYINTNFIWIEHLL